MPCYSYSIEDGPTFCIVSGGDGFSTIFANGTHIITSGSPKSCIQLVVDMNADMFGFEEWRFRIPRSLNEWDEYPCEG